MAGVTAPVPEATSAARRAPRAQSSVAQRAVKRGIDIAVSLAGLVILAPVFAAIAVGIRIASPGPVLFRQTRAGRGGRPFTLLKFRSMDPTPPAQLHTSREDPRVFPLGRVLREYHLDELPQLWNVLRGDMSLVGPRPTVMSQVEQYTPEQRERLRVRPGLTGLAQVSGNNELPWRERIAIDVRYVREASLGLDARILARTIGTVLRREGVYGHDGHVRDEL